MKKEASYYKVNLSEKESFRCIRECRPNLATSWHFHPEYQITLVARGNGHRLIGDNVSTLQPGDLTFLGPHLPHFWHTEDHLKSNPAKIDAVIIQFLGDFLGADFFLRPELRAVEDLFQRSSRGLYFRGPACRSVMKRIDGLPDRTGMDRMLELLMVLQELAALNNAETITSPQFLPDLNYRDQQRLEHICRYIYAHLDRPIGRDELARLVDLSPRTFSRYFLRKMGKPIPRFVNELRIGRACRLLLEDDMAILEVALNSGFQNLSIFNHWFKLFTNTTPREYRKRQRHILGNNK